jgi:hypothetical protein
MNSVVMANSSQRKLMKRRKLNNISVGGGNEHVHPILLWLQRDFVSTFDGDPMAGRDEETPHDLTRQNHRATGGYLYVGCCAT